MDLQELAMVNPSHLYFMAEIYTPEELHNTSTNPAFFGTAQSLSKSLLLEAKRATYKILTFREKRQGNP
jgi:hypothetical protein